MSTTECEPGRPADEAEAPRERRGVPDYAVTLAALNAALAEPLPVDGEADAPLATGEV